MVDNYAHIYATMTGNGVLFVNAVKLMVRITFDPPFQSSSLISFSILGISMENLLIRLKAWTGFPTSLLVKSASDSLTTPSSSVLSNSDTYLE